MGSACSNPAFQSVHTPGNQTGKGTPKFPRKTPRLRIVVVGGGPAGLAAGIALQRDLHHVTVYERCEAYHGGFGWILMPNGIAVLENLGVKDKILENCVPLTKTQIWKKSGDQEQLHTHEMEETYTASRSALVEGLLAELKPGTVKLGYTCVEAKLEESADGKQQMGRLVFAATRTSSQLPTIELGPNDFDVVIAADGVHSRVAACCQPDLQRKMTRRVNTLVTVHHNPVLAEQIEGTFLKTMFRQELQCCAVGLLTPSPGKVLGFVQFDTEIHGFCPEEHALRHEFVLNTLQLKPSESRNAPDAVYAFFEGGATFSEPNSHLWKPPAFDEESLEKQPFSLGNIILIGDAAHPLSDFTSQGVSSALEDAIAVSSALQTFQAHNKVLNNKSRSMTFKARLANTLQNVAASRRVLVEEYFQKGVALEQDFLSSQDSLPFVLGDGMDTDAILSAESTQASAQQSPLCSSSNSTYDHDDFADSVVDIEVLRNCAYNYRWAALDEGVIPLTAASSDFPVAQPIRDAVKQYMDTGHCHYGPNEGLPEFCDALARAFQSKVDKAVSAAAEGLAHAAGIKVSGKTRTVTAERVMATNSAAAGVYHAVARVLDSPGDEALVMAPVDFLLSSSVTALPGRKQITYSIKKQASATSSQGNNSAVFDLTELEALVTPRTKLLSVCNPHNPLGRAWTAVELSSLADFAERHDLAILSDEVWSDIVFEPLVHIPMAAVSPAAARRTYTVLGFSKNFGLEGTRVGGLIAPSAEDLKQCLHASATDTTAAGTSVLAQVAAIAAMAECEDWLSKWRNHLNLQLEYAVSRLNRMPGVGHVDKPEACFVIYCDITNVFKFPRPSDAAEFADQPEEMALMQYLIKVHKVAIIPGLSKFFGPHGNFRHMRISVGTSRQVLEEGMNRLEHGLKAWIKGGQDTQAQGSPRDSWALSDL